MSESLTVFEAEQWSIALNQVTWVEKKRDGAVTVHFPGSDLIIMNKTHGPAFLEAFNRYHASISDKVASKV